MRVCPACGSAVFHEESRSAEPVTVPLLRALAWPFRPVSMITLAVVIVGSGLASYAPFGMWIAGGIRFGYLAAVLRAGSLGQDDVEIDPTQIGSAMWEWSAPFVRFLFTALISFGPAVLAAWLLGPAGIVPAAILGVLGAIYFPAALIVAAHAEGFFAWLRPDLPIRLIFQIPRPYAVACGLLLALAAVSGGAMAAAEAFDIPVMGFLLSAVLGFVPLVAAARLLGVLVHENREDL